MKLYVDRFNRRDWDGVRELISADARLTVADAFVGKLADAPYFRNYERFSTPWKLAMDDVDGEPVVIILRRGADTWTPYSIVRLSVIGQLCSAKNQKPVRDCDVTMSHATLNPARTEFVRTTGPKTLNSHTR